MLLANTIYDETPAPYRSVRHALRSAFNSEGRDIVKSPALFQTRLSDSDLSPYDRCAQSAIVLSLLHENCRLDVIRAVTALYMPADAGPARGRMTGKREAVAGMAWHVQSYPHLSGYPWAYLCDVVCLWADAPMHKTEPEWMDELGKSSRQLRRIKFGNRDRGRPGVCQILDDLLDEAAFVLGEVFVSRGLI